MTFKIKDTNYLDETVFRKFYNDKIWITWGLFVDKGSGSGIFPDPGDPKRPDPAGDPDPQHCYVHSIDIASYI